MSSEAPGTRNPLLIPELFYGILDFLAEPTSEPSRYDLALRTPDPDGRRALAALALTCRGFTEASLDLLWCNLDSLRPLLRCFQPREVIFGGMRALRLPSPADWTVIKRYAHRIQQLEVQNDNSYLLLACAIFESNLLPNLKVLKWRKLANINPVGITYIQPLLGPGLAVLDVCGSEHDIALASFLQSCPSRCPGVTTVRFHILVEVQFGLVDILSRALRSFKNLKYLTVDTRINDGALQHFLMSPQFEELSLWIRSYQLPEFSPPPSDIPLRNVKKLCLKLEDLRLITELLRPGDQSFCEITLRHQKLESATLISSLFTGLASRPQKSLLRSLHLHNARVRFDISDSEAFVLSFDTFRPLTCHTNLRNLMIKLENPISLSDEELADLAHNWPLLQVFELCYVCLPPPWGAKQMTFKGLLLLVTKCPELRHVCLTLDGREVPSGVAAGLGSKAITSLCFPNSPINNQGRLVAKFLLTHFPSLTELRSEIRHAVQAGPERLFRRDRHDKEWAEVEAYLVEASKVESTEPGVNDSNSVSRFDMRL